MFEFNLNLTLQIQLEKITNTYSHPVIHIRPIKIPNKSNDLKI